MRERRRGLGDRRAAIAKIQSIRVNRGTRKWIGRSGGIEIDRQRCIARHRRSGELRNRRFVGAGEITYPCVISICTGSLHGFQESSSCSGQDVCVTDNASQSCTGFTCIPCKGNPGCGCARSRETKWGTDVEFKGDCSICVGSHRDLRATRCCTGATYSCIERPGRGWISSPNSDSGRSRCIGAKRIHLEKDCLGIPVGVRNAEKNLPLSVWWQNGVAGASRIQCLHLHNEGKRVVGTGREGLADVNILDSQLSRCGIGRYVAGATGAIYMNVGEKTHTQFAPVPAR